MTNQTVTIYITPLFYWLFVNPGGSAAQSVSRLNLHNNILAGNSNLGNTLVFLSK